MSRNRKLILTAAIVILLICGIFAVSQGKLEDIHYGAVCCNCLRPARFHIKKYLGITYYKECTLIPRQSSLFPSPDSADMIPEGEPNLYEQIYGRKCTHYFAKKGRFGKTSGGLHSDGISMEWIFYSRRLKGISSVYRLFELTQDKNDAQNSFRIIDALHPVKEKQPRAGQILEMYVDELTETTGLERWKKTNQEYFKMLQLESQAP